MIYILKLDKHLYLKKTKLIFLLINWFCNFVTMQIIIKDLTKIKKSAKKFIKAIGDNRIFAFYGEMGIGKTTFINAVLEELGIEDHSSSPTFSIVNEYFSIKHGAVYHFDFYRIENQMEALDIGIEDIIYDNNFCFIEWPENIENLLPNNTVNIVIKNDNNCRTLDINL